MPSTTTSAEPPTTAPTTTPTTAPITTPTTAPTTTIVASSSSTSSTATTTIIPATTTTIPAPVPTTTTTSLKACSISIEPDTAELVSGQTLTFTITPDGDCSELSYEWSVQGTIASSCDQGGNYVAGINFDVFNPATDVVSVVDNGNGGISVEAMVMVSACPLVKIYGEYSGEVELLRYIRDNVLTQTIEGQEIIRLYYEWSPVIVKAMEEDEAFEEEVKEMVGGFLELLLE